MNHIEKLGLILFILGITFLPHFETIGYIIVGTIVSFIGIGMFLYEKE